MSPVRGNDRELILAEEDTLEEHTRTKLKRIVK